MEEERKEYVFMIFWEYPIFTLRLQGLAFFFFFREFQHMVSAPNDSSLSSDQDTNQFLV